MITTLFKEAIIVNEGQETVADVLVKNGRISKIGQGLSVAENHVEINAAGRWLMPGVIDDQVHFREPGLTHKATIGSESRAAVAGGVTSFMEMPNTNPPATTRALLEDKYAIAAKSSVANYSFFMGTTNDNADEVLQTDSRKVCGIKIFMGSSTGNMLVDSESTLSRIFCNTPMLIATHCEDEVTVRNRMEAAIAQFGEDIPAHWHPVIRNEEACYLSSSKAIEIAKKCGTRLHVLHITTADELPLFTTAPLNADKKITSEVCVHHLWYTADDYAEKGNLIKCNPAIKAAHHRTALRAALAEGRIDVVATDHAPHTWEEKQNKYAKSPSGLPLIQYTLQTMLEIGAQEGWSKAFVAEKMAHNPAILFAIEDRGYIREGYWADLVLVSDKYKVVNQEELLYHCNWSPMVGQRFRHTIDGTWVSGEQVWDGQSVNDHIRGQRLLFNRV